MKWNHAASSLWENATIPEDFEYRNDLADCQMPSHDMLGKRLMWIVMDWLPHRMQKQKAVMDRLRSGDSYTWM